jgi:ATP-binding protein involved in chromosome partitioning
MTESAIRSALESIRDPDTGRTLGKTGQIKTISINGNSATVKAELGTFAAPLKKDFAEEIEQAARSVEGIETVKVSIDLVERTVPEMGKVGLRAKAVIAVGSGKGGVGKSTVALALALALKRAGCRAGLLDADVYGPSLPQMTGVRGQVAKSGEKIAPHHLDGMPLMSIGFMVPPDQAVIWRGPMLHSAVTTFVRDVDWGSLDYLIIDMPPGTGDVALTLSQLLPVTGAVVVCTPQEVALIDAVKAVGMFRQVKIPLAGMVENMSGFICPDCSKRYDIFGSGGARQYAEEAGIPFLGEIPINIQLRVRGDEGKALANFDDPHVGPCLDRIAWNLSKHLSVQAMSKPLNVSLPVLG